MLQRLRDHAHRLKRETMALYYAARDPATPWYAKAVVAFAVGYALSPIDPVPDFIPVLGLLDELILLPLALALAVRLTPAPVMERARRRAQEAASGTRPRSRTAAAFIVLTWLGLVMLGAWVVVRVR
ncbi:MAG: DUF1232 domain-containing protein [Burkholderiales bacterium]|nr:DUF1232 domain-containing protein [Burkholderiales bacterium]PZN01231.1 MAG: hypothetical protein DIU74_10390 [Pseudomonadota bacterium]